MNTHLDANLKQLRLPGIRQNLSIRLQEAQSSQLSHEQFLELATCAFIRQHTDLLMIGPPGTGKAHLAQAIGYEAIKRGHTVRYISIFELVRELMDEEALASGRLLIIDDMGLKQLPPRAGEHLFEVIMRRYELRSTLMTSNRSIEDWGYLIGDVPAAGAILDRLLQSAEVIPFKGRSYRLRNKTENHPETPVDNQEKKGDL